MAVLTPDIAQKLLKEYFANGLAKVNEIAKYVPDDPMLDVNTEIEGLKGYINILRKQIAARDFDSGVITDARVLVDQAGYTDAEKIDENMAIVCTGMLPAKET